MTKIIPYSTPYADDRINGYVKAVYDEDKDMYVINERQMDMARRNLTIGGVMPTFHADKNVYVVDGNGNKSYHYPSWY